MTLLVIIAVHVLLKAHVWLVMHGLYSVYISWSWQKSTTARFDSLHVLSAAFINVVMIKGTNEGSIQFSCQYV